MKGLWLQDGVLSIRDSLPVPVPGHDEALLKVRTAGICGTDLQMVRGYASFTGVLGHEFVADVVECPADASWVGKRVVGEINVGCGQCRDCQTGRRNHCSARKVLGIRGLNGSFAEYFLLPVGNLLQVPSDLSDSAAVFVEPLAAAAAAVESAALGDEDDVLLIGAGRLGQLIARIVGMNGRPLAVSVRHARQERALNRAGLQWKPWNGATSFDVVFEASGQARGWADALKAVRPRGCIVLKSTFADSASVNLSSLVVDEIRVIGSRCGPFDRVLQLMTTGVVDGSDLIDEVRPLDDGLAAFERAARPDTMKVLLRP